MAVEEGAAKYGVLPFENSYTGEVGEVLDLLHEHDVSIVDTLALPIDQNLLGIKGASIKDIKQIYSHQQGLSQCAQFLSGRAVELIPYPNTALAAKMCIRDINRDHIDRDHLPSYRRGTLYRDRHPVSAVRTLSWLRKIVYVDRFDRAVFGYSCIARVCLILG